jgi:hypothetical protein
VVVPKCFASENVQPASRCILLKLTVPDSRVVFRKPLPKTREILLWKSFHRADGLLYGAHVKSLLLSSLVRNPSVRPSPSFGVSSQQVEGGLARFARGHRRLHLPPSAAAEEISLGGLEKHKPF